MPMSDHKTILGFILLLTLVRGVIYASIVPPWQAPDEPAQFERVRASQSILEWNSTSENEPDWYDDLIVSLFTFNHWDFTKSSRPEYVPNSPAGNYIPLYQEIYGGLYGSRPAYVAIGWPLFLARSQHITLQLYWVRLNTVLMNVGIVVLAYLITKTIFPTQSFLILGVPLLIMFNPQHTHILSTVNNGNFAELLATLTLYFVIRSVIKGFSWVNSFLILIFSLLAIWAKATAYFLPFVIATIGVFYLWQYRRYWRWLIAPTIIAVGVSLYFIPLRFKLLLITTWQNLDTGALGLDPIVPLDLFRSFWAMPGAAVVKLHPVWYQLLAIGCILAVIGLAICAKVNYRKFFLKQYQSQFQAIVILIVAATVALGILLSWNTLTNTIIYRQGRSIYPVIVPISLFIMLGWQQLIPPIWRNQSLIPISLALFLFDTMVLFNYIVPFFYSRY